MLKYVTSLAALLSVWAAAVPVRAAGTTSVPTTAAPPADSGESTANAPRRAAVGASEALLEATGRAGLRPEVLELALQAHARAVAAGHTDRALLTVIDYSRPSREPRLWVVDLDSARVLAHELVAHGEKSGGDLATAFSNRHGSHQTSIGTFVTGATYHGKHGLSLRLRGLDEGLNDQAAARAIVVHGADYVNPGIVKQLGRLGRSHGCPALSRSAAPRVIDLIKGGTVVFSYYPSPALERTLAAR